MGVRGIACCYVPAHWRQAPLLWAGACIHTVSLRLHLKVNERTLPMQVRPQILHVVHGGTRQVLHAGWAAARAAFVCAGASVQSRKVTHSMTTQRRQQAKKSKLIRRYL